MLVTHNSDYQVIVLAAGSGTSLRPLTQDVPKALIPVGNRPLIWYTLHRLEQQGFFQVHVVVQKSDVKLLDYLRETYASNSVAATKIRISQTDTDNAADALRSIRDKIKTKFIVMSCDLIASFDLNDIIDEHRINDATATVVLGDMGTAIQDLISSPDKQQHPQQQQQQQVVQDKKRGKLFHDFITYEPKTNRLVGMRDIADLSNDSLSVSRKCLRKFPSLRIATNLHDTHTFVFEKWVLDYLCYNSEIGSFRELVSVLIRAQYRKKVALSLFSSLPISMTASQSFSIATNLDMVSYSNRSVTNQVMDVSVYMHRPTSLCLRVNRFERYLIANQIVINPQHDIFKMIVQGQLYQNISVGSDSIAGKGVKMGEKCVVKKSIIGNHCTIGKNVKIINSVVLDHVTIHDHVSIMNTVICSDVYVNANVDIKDSKVGPGFTIPAKSQVKNEVLQADDDMNF